MQKRQGHDANVQHLVRLTPPNKCYREIKLLRSLGTKFSAVRTDLGFLLSGLAKVDVNWEVRP